MPQNGGWKFFLHEYDEQEEWQQADAILEQTESKRLCTACNGSALSPYPQDGGSCPHCFGGYLT